ncbi:hypothetical protein SARC_04013 [Sphaeroforma arctica JP610]|uniref:Helicase ATP-binding domain-containing protein n=1 Tax=Sphaeroforma arctica JP610 TaxID=667725 RepID=A0A0L0G6B9_9EUKA|nr:hypothetical protein SARC_04013 [Sphaeroforma arctica JP610]KNC83763.1 hypothetical protein SARC_04013 [Sphaeroforma arctica JP610]|eukprot:XP_014157665.1 hypothetical protein SARC_04013 [Sphaeroforma arctica JP610]
MPTIQVVENLLMGNDCAVFWATGQGKSLCYQLPSMFTNRPSVIVSPLISLMEDQCAKLNSTVLAANGPIATFLGSGQRDPTEEGAALNGERLFIYVTPERMCRSDFLESLARLHSRKPLALIAIDEAHCVSSWGHDFRNY